MMASSLSRLLFRASLPLAGAAGALLLIMSPASAQEVFRGTEGGYEISVTIEPEAPTVGVVHFTIVPLDGATSRPVEVARVRLTANDPAGQPAYTSLALSSPASPGEYEANLTIETPGDWTLTVDVESDELGEASFTAPLQIVGEPIEASVGAAILWALLTSVLVLGAAYLWIMSRREVRQRSPEGA